MGGGVLMLKTQVTRMAALFRLAAGWKVLVWSRRRLTDSVKDELQTKVPFLPPAMEREGAVGAWVGGLGGLTLH